MKLCGVGGCKMSRLECARCGHEATKQRPIYRCAAHDVLAPAIESIQPRLARCARTQRLCVVASVSGRISCGVFLATRVQSWFSPSPRREPPQNPALSSLAPRRSMLDTRPAAGEVGAQRRPAKRRTSIRSPHTSQEQNYRPRTDAPCARRIRESGPDRTVEIESGGM